MLSMYAKGMSTSDMESYIRDMYGLSVSDTTISRVTDKIMPVVKEWQVRPLESIYAVVFLDAIYFHVRSEGQIIRRLYTSPSAYRWMAYAMCWACGSARTSAKFWLGILNAWTIS
jgi:hypothetical protein